MLAAALASMLPLHGAVAQEAPAAEVARDFDLPAGDLAAALDALGTQGGIALVYAPGLVAGRQAEAVKGRLTRHEALGRLLHGTGLGYRLAGEGTVVIEGAGEGVASGDLPSRAEPDTTTPKATPAATDLSQVTVTGTRIRGGTTPSPVITIGAEDIRDEGFADLGEVIRAVPQNFSGGQNPGVASGAIGSGNLHNQNATGGSSLNLRGMGADATLTLLNGRRMAYGGFGQAVDISAIPVEAVDRLEIVADGASAIYGSDAVAGVGNVILRRDFDGIVLGARHGMATDGGLATREYNATAGTVWTGGGFLATFKHRSSAPIYADQRDYTSGMRAPTTIYQGSRLRSGLVSAHQSFGESVELRMDALRTERKRNGYQRYPNFYYDSRGQTTTTFAAPSVEVWLPGGWSLVAGAAWGKDENINSSRTVTVATGASALSAHSCYCNESRSYEAGIEGPLFELRGGDARLATGVGYRKNDFLNQNIRTGTRQSGEEGSRFAYAEINLPIVGPDSGVAGVRRLELTAAARGEDYDSFGSVTTPKLGLVYGPSADFTLKASWGRSFKAPLLNERYGNRFAYLVPARLVGGIGYGADATVLLSWGGNPGLDAERARSLSASLAFHPEALPALEAELTWFDVDYNQRVIQPLTATTQILSNPALGVFVDYAPTREDQAELLATYSYAFMNQTGAPYDPDNVVAIGWGHYTNAMRQRISGIDLSGSYRFDLGSGRLTLRGSAGWLDSSRQNSAGESPYDLAGLIFYPAKASGRLGAVWTGGGFTSSAFVNHVGGVTDHVRRVEGGSFTTVDTTLRYAIGRLGASAPGWEFTLGVQNLLDRAPPLYMPATVMDVPYDSTNYSAIGRFVNVSLSKAW